MPMGNMNQKSMHQGHWEWISSRGYIMFNPMFPARDGSHGHLVSRVAQLGHEWNDRDTKQKKKDHLACINHSQCTREPKFCYWPVKKDIATKYYEVLTGNRLQIIAWRISDRKILLQTMRRMSVLFFTKHAIGTSWKQDQSLPSIKRGSKDLPLSIELHLSKVSFKEISNSNDLS